jgi:N-acetylglutamate synthase-like GNAT family acetyltransferase
VKNVVTEWKEVSNGIYLANALNYIENCISNADSDLQSITNHYQKNGGAFWVVVGNSTSLIIGMCAIEPKENGIGEIRRCCVRNNYQRRRIGSLLLDRCKQFARQNGLRSLLAQTPSHPKGPTEFYKKNGFKVIRQNDSIHCTPVREDVLTWDGNAKG